MAKQQVEANKLIAANIKRTRTERGLSQFELAKKIGVGCDTLNHYETAHVPVTEEVLWDISMKIDMTVDWFLKGKPSVVSVNGPF